MHTFLVSRYARLRSIQKALMSEIVQAKRQVQISDARTDSRAHACRHMYAQMLERERQALYTVNPSKERNFWLAIRKVCASKQASDLLFSTLQPTRARACVGHECASVHWVEFGYGDTFMDVRMECMDICQYTDVQTQCARRTWTFVHD